ncbi:MAG: CopL family metal-binding regulatory protein [Lysobacter sp.]
MSIQHLLLRVLLCVSLILNGSGIAVAATQMHVQHVGMNNALAVPAPAADDQSICGEHLQGSTPTLEAVSCEMHSMAADCCEGDSACDVVCPAGMLWTVMVPAQGWWVASHILAVRPSFASHPAPLLQNRYRPPIR